MLSCSASAFTVTYPTEVTVGDEITISGTDASPEDELDSGAVFETYAEIGNDGRYEYKVEWLNIPSSPNTVSVTADDVENIKVTVSIAPIFSIGPSAEADANFWDEAGISMSNVPAVTYPLIKVEGDPIENPTHTGLIPLTFKCVSYITTENDGTFKYTYDTSGLPTGEYFITIVDGTQRAKFFVDVIKASATTVTTSSTSSTSVKMVTITSQEIEETSTDETTEEDTNTKKSSSSGGYSASEVVVVDKTSTEERSEEKNTTAVEASVQMSVTDETETDDQTTDEMTVANDEPQESSGILGKFMSWLLKII